MNARATNDYPKWQGRYKKVTKVELLQMKNVIIEIKKLSGWI